MDPHAADDRQLHTPAGGDAGGQQVEIEFEVISTYRPRLVRVKAGDGTGVAQEYPIAGDDRTGAEAHGAGVRARDPLLTIILWALYEACRAEARYGDRNPPWERPRHARAWRAFQRAMLSAPDLHQRLSDPTALLEQARATYRAHHHGLGG